MTDYRNRPDRVWTLREQSILVLAPGDAALNVPDGTPISGRGLDIVDQFSADDSQRTRSIPDEGYLS